MSVRDGAWNPIVALAGIGATAILGLAGLGVTVITSKEDRESAERLTRQTLVYDRRSDVYVAALEKLRPLRSVASNPERFRADLRSFLKEEGVLGARLTAFGSAHATRLYNNMTATLLVALRQITPRPFTSRFSETLLDFSDALDEFAQVVNQELSAHPESAP